MCSSSSLTNPVGILTSTPEPERQILPNSPLVVSAATAIQQLRSLKPVSAREAVEQLAARQESSRILLLYRRYFPLQFARSTASTLIPIHDRDASYSERELEFFRLVDEHLFPLPEIMFDMERLSSIPIYPHIVKLAER